MRDAARRWLFDVELAWVRFWRRPARTLVGTWAVTVAVTAVTFVLSLGDGLHQYLTQRLQAFTPALWVEAPGTGPDPVAHAILAQPGVAGISRHATAPVLVSSGRSALPARLEAYEPGAMETVLPGSRRLFRGVPPERPGEVALGAQLAAQLGVAAGGTVLLTAAGGESQSAAVVGIVQAGLATIDAQLVLTTVETAAAAAPDARWGYAVAVDPGVDLASLRLALQQATGLWVQPWYEGRSSFLEALAVERQVMLWISLAAVVTAAFATASVTALRVMEQRYELAILQAVGAGFSHILRTVLAETLTSALVSSALGAALGWAAGWALSQRPLPLPPQFGLAYLPVQSKWSHAALAAGLTLACTAAASIAPALRVARLDPAELLREK